MQDLRSVLIVVGALAIAALLLHGLWSSRKEKPAKFSEKPFSKLDNTRDSEGFDQDGIGSVRTVSPAPESAAPKAERKEPELHFENTIESDPLMEPIAATTAPQADITADDLPHITATDAAVALDTADVAVAEQVEEAKEEPVAQTAAEPEVAAAVNEEAEEELPMDYLILNVLARNDQVIEGKKLINSLENNNLYFGENSVYHCHTGDAGTGSVLFSVGNLLSPGSFPESSTDFTTPGVMFAFELPCEGRADQIFDTMLQTAQQVADELSADVLDHERKIVSSDRLAEYRQKAKRYTR